MKVFWSWQSDTLSKNNHFFVRDALTVALQQVASDLDLTEADRPEVDHDTKGRPGLVSIVDTIFEKIDEAAVFVGDLTFIGSTEKGKLLPNPNVMIELGHAITKLGPERIILVTNAAYGGRPEDLPFDLRHRRAPISYKLLASATTEDRKKEQQSLVQALIPALKGCLGLVLDQVASKLEFPSVIPRHNDRSIWLLENEPIKHLDYFHDGGVNEWEVIDQPRFYLRIIPAKYEGSINPRDIHNLPQHLKLSLLGRWTNGDGGVNSLGCVEVGITHDDKVHAATQWFKKTGEVWAFNSGATHIDDKGRRLLAWHTIARGWREHMNRTFIFLNHIGAKGPFQIEAGVTGLQDSFWEIQFNKATPALENEIFMIRVDAKWEPQKCEKFLTDSFNLLAEAFNQPTYTVEKYLQIN